MEPFIGQIWMFGGNFAPRAWALCDGQLMAISQNTALFSILGTTYGGDGRTTFALPDLRGRLALHSGTGPGLTTRRLGSRFGVEEMNMNTLTLASHTHLADLSNLEATWKLNVSTAAGTEQSPGGKYLSQTAGGLDSFIDEGTPNKYLGGVNGIVGGTVSVGNTGNSQAIDVMMPAQVVNYIICTQGIYPSRS